MTQTNQIEETTRQTEIVNLLCEGLTHEEIGNRLGISRRTVERDLTAFVESAEFGTWLKTEWLRVHQIMLKTSPREAYRALSQLIKRGGVEVNLTQNNISTIRVVFGDSLQVIDAEPVNGTANNGPSDQRQLSEQDGGKQGT